MNSLLSRSRNDVPATTLLDVVATERSMKMTLQCRLGRAIHYPFLGARTRLFYAQLDMLERGVSYLRKNREDEMIIVDDHCRRRSIRVVVIS